MRFSTLWLANILVVFFLGASLGWGAGKEKGDLFQITKFKRYNTAEGRGILLEFKIRGKEIYNDLDYEIYLYDGKKRRIRGGIEESYIYGDSRYKTKKYSRNPGSGKAYLLSGYRPGETYSYLYIIGKNYSYAVAEVGNRKEKVYSIIPFGKLEDFIQQ